MSPPRSRTCPAPERALAPWLAALLLATPAVLGGCAGLHPEPRAGTSSRSATSDADAHRASDWSVERASRRERGATDASAASRATAATDTAATERAPPARTAVEIAAPAADLRGPLTHSSGRTASSAEPAQERPTGTRELPVPGFLPALVDWPRTASWPQPTLIAAHGAGDSAESQCASWRELLGDRGIVLCLRGRAIARGAPHRGYYYPDHLALERETLAALAALTKHSPEFADVERLVYTGYSQGAQMGALMLLGRGALAPRLLLIEGGSGDWTQAYAQRFAKSGGERVFFVCGTPRCRQNAERSVTRLERAGIMARARYAPGGGHTYLGSVARDVAAAFAELTADDPRWAAPAARR